MSPLITEGGDIIKRLCVVGDISSVWEESIMSVGDMKDACDDVSTAGLLDWR